MILPRFDQTKTRKHDGSHSLEEEAEAVRLSNKLRAKPSRFFIDINGLRVDFPAKRGFDCETADFMTMVNWLADTRIKKSESLRAFVHRILAVRFPTEYAQHRDKINTRYKIEYEMIQANSKNDVFWFGEVGFSNQVRLDGSLTNRNNKVVKNRNGEIRIVRR